MGFLKCYYTAGMVGGVAGYFSYPPGGFEADLGDPMPSWLQQMVTLAHAQALFAPGEPDPARRSVARSQSAPLGPGPAGLRVSHRRQGGPRDGTSSPPTAGVAAYGMGGRRPGSRGHRRDPGTGNGETSGAGLRERLPTRTAEEFLEFLQAAAASGSGGSSPPPIVAFLATHAAAKAFVESPKPIPASYARQAYFAVTAFKFTNAAGQSRFGRFRLRPDAGTEFLTSEQLARKTADFLAAELSQRLAKGPVGFRVLVQLAEAADDVTDSTALWPESRPQAEFGTIAITGRVDELAPDRQNIIFDPLPRVEGIDSAGDPLTEVRSELYLLSGRL